MHNTSTEKSDVVAVTSLGSWGTLHGLTDESPDAVMGSLSSRSKQLINNETITINDYQSRGDCHPPEWP